jgi:hypothetical protein
MSLDKLPGPLPIEVRCGWTPQHDDFDRVAFGFERT